MSSASAILVPMDEADFSAFLTTSITAYAQDNIRSGRWSAEEGQQKAEQEFQQLLPDGLATPNHYLCTIQDTASREKVGVFWFNIAKSGGKTGAFIYDIIVKKQFRRRGYAEQALLEMEKQVLALGADTIGLHVFGHNPGARALYEKLGYITTNIVMSKKLLS